MTATYSHLVPLLKMFLTLSDEMTKVHEWIKANKLLINFDVKFHDYVFFQKSIYSSQNLHLYVNGNEIKQVAQCTFLAPLPGGTAELKMKHGFSNADSSVVVGVGVGVGVNFKGGKGQSQKRFSNLFSFLA